MNSSSHSSRLSYTHPLKPLRRPAVLPISGAEERSDPKRSRRRAGRGLPAGPAPYAQSTPHMYRSDPSSSLVELHRLLSMAEIGYSLSRPQGSVRNQQHSTNSGYRLLSSSQENF